VLQEARVSNDPQLDPRRCAQVRACSLSACLNRGPSGDGLQGKARPLLYPGGLPGLSVRRLDGFWRASSADSGVSSGIPPALHSPRNRRKRFAFSCPFCLRLPRSSRSSCICSTKETPSQRWACDYQESCRQLLWAAGSRRQSPPSCQAVAVVEWHPTGGTVTWPKGANVLQSGAAFDVHLRQSTRASETCRAISH